MHSQPSRASSYLEVVLVLGLVSLLALTSLPSQGAFIASGRLRQAAGVLRDDLLSLFLAAALREQDVIVDLQGSHYRAFTEQAPEITLLSRRLPRKVSFLDSKPVSLRFYSTGIASPARLVLRDGALECSLTVSLRGRIRRLC